MTAQERRGEILDILQKAKAPVSASALAGRLSVSRQVIVGDVALLRASGTPVSATPRGYVLSTAAPEAGVRRIVACCHSAGELEKELQIMVDNGCLVEDVIVEHPVYGQITAPLQLASRWDVEQFISRVESEEARPLSALTGGVHLHTLCCGDEDAFDRVTRQLEREGFLLRD